MAGAWPSLRLAFLATRPYTACDAGEAGKAVDRGSRPSRDGAVVLGHARPRQQLRGHRLDHGVRADRLWAGVSLSRGGRRLPAAVSGDYRWRVVPLLVRPAYNHGGLPGAGQRGHKPADYDPTAMRLPTMRSFLSQFVPLPRRLKDKWPIMADGSQRRWNSRLLEEWASSTTRQCCPSLPRQSTIPIGGTN